MIRELKLQRKSENTIRSYLMSVSQLAKHFGRPPEKISREEVRDFIYYLINDRKLATGTINTKVAGIQFFYQHVMQQPKFDLHVKRKRTGRLPDPLSRKEVAKVLDSVSNIKHRVMLMTTYSAGLRVSEVVNLEVKDIHSDRMLIHIRQAKRDKDRFTILSERLLQELRSYWLIDRPSRWLFPNAKGEAMSRTALQLTFYRAKTKAGITHGHGIHCLRHSFATHLLEAGVDLTIIARLLGHRSISTTSRYLHVTNKHVQGIRSPLDLIRMPGDEIEGQA
jgi:site-specific recombinase XerD